MCYYGLTATYGHARTREPTSSGTDHGARCSMRTAATEHWCLVTTARPGTARRTTTHHEPSHDARTCTVKYSNFTWFELNTNTRYSCAELTLE